MASYGLLGGKLGHSLSPEIHRLFFAHTGISGTYELWETETADLSARLAELSKSCSGANVTIPHKLAVMPFLKDVSAEAAAIGAVNTLQFTSQGIFGYNTDYFGFGRLLAANDIKARAKVTAVLGTGGAARAVLKYLTDAGVAKIYLVTRTPEKADISLQTLAPNSEIIGYETLSTVKGALLVNCTPVGMYPRVEASPVAAAVTANFDAVVDLIYNPSQTLLLKQAQQAGKKFANGLFMLVAQAVAAQEIWQGERYDETLILKIMQELEHSL